MERALEPSQAERSRRRGMELIVFLFLAIFLAPAIAIAGVGGYGFMVWTYQMIAGPPGPPAKAPSTFPDAPKK